MTPLLLTSLCASLQASRTSSESMVVARCPKATKENCFFLHPAGLIHVIPAQVLIFYQRGTSWFKIKIVDQRPGVGLTRLHVA
ncbi:hypothetical protein FA15DRAFT_664055 [Coprinopsis marcescibilis]|uniref:Secreted protein n=1 Tax=Coprinopsis marcescibilis TaxID=230819 RepID=A0A5C3LLG4_COPMA|nr:hypothetical protein FA15DRAFT_664055 [Coprinopsis marcescibilis]